ncbi:hypothetical protein SLE2022_248310 [Rubroshorea leprosula]
MEVVTIVGTTVLSVSLEWLIKKLGSKSSALRNSRKHVRENLQNWKSFLPKLRAVLDDAEQRQTANPAVEMWLSDLRHLAYDMEDVLDGLEADERRKKLTANTNQVQPSTSKARKLIPICFTSFYHDDFILDCEVVSKIKEISVRLECVVREKEALGLRVGEAGPSIAAPRWEPATTWLPEPHVYGREGDKDAILQKMLNDEGSDENPCVIPIVGMGGLGKTTLARLVYNDDGLKGVFELKAWVCVSSEFDVLQITRSILEQATQRKCDSKDPSVLQEKLNNTLSGKKFLLVLDDVWSEDYCCWDVLQRVFISGAKGSKIIVTSRIEGVAKTMGAGDRIYHLKELPKNECMSLLARHAFGRENFDVHLYLKDIGEEIVKRCSGLPLAVKTLGGLLRGELNPDKWVKVLKSEMWELPEERCYILPALRLSYHHLPAHLKKCFAYCSLFPKDHEFCKDDLVLLWMAEGFVQQQKNGVGQMKSMGDQYFCDLLSRGLFQQSSTKQSCFVMHDLVHDLAQYVAGETCYNLEKMFHSEKMVIHLEKVRHLSISALGVEALRRLRFLDKSNNLRTFLALPSCDHYNEGHNMFFQELLQKLRCSRVLSFNDKIVSEIPTSIGNLKHLRYIDFSCSQIQSLPDSVRFLVYLQTLILHDCSRITELPASVVDLVDLHHLDIRGTNSLQKMPSQMALQVEECGELIFLLEDGDSISSLAASLKSIIISRCPFLVSLAGQEQKHLPGSLEKLRIANCANLEHLPTGLHNLTCLKQLSIGRCKKFAGFLVTDFPLYLHRLNLSDLEALESLPDELMMTTKEIIICNCPRLKSFLVGKLLPMLQNSTIDRGIEVVNPLRNLGFPIDYMHELSCLCYFEIVNCESLESLPERVLSIPTLQTLWIMSCKSLKSLPNGMYNCESLQNLEISGCPSIASIARGSLPPNLKDLVIDCEGLNESMLEYWGIDRLTCLKYFEINWICPPDDLLPTSLTTLIIKGVYNLESISRGLLQNLASLKKLEILDCPILKTLPKEGLPPSLEKFQIRGCPLLKQRCLKEKGDYWPLISHIQEINIW